MRNIIVLLFLVLSISCSQEKAIDFKIQKDIRTEVIVEDLYVRIPGDFIILDNYFILIDPTDGNNAIKVYDRIGGKFRFDAAVKGYGPKELIMPSTIWFRNGIEIFDIAGQKIITYEADMVNMTIRPVFEQNLETESFISKLIGYEYLRFIAISEELHGVVSHLNFEDKSNNAVLNYPIENLTPSLLSNQFNGTLRLDPTGKFFAYSAYNTPYFSVHKIENDSIYQLSSKFLTEPHFRITGGKFQWDEEKNIIGFMDMALADNSLFLLHSNVLQVEANNRSISSIPNIMYEFDFSGKPITRFVLDRRILRLAMSIEGELFGIALDEKDNKFKIIKIPI